MGSTVRNDGAGGPGYRTQDKIVQSSIVPKSQTVTKDARCPSSPINITSPRSVDSGTQPSSQKSPTNPCSFDSNSSKKPISKPSRRMTTKSCSSRSNKNYRSHSRDTDLYLDSDDDAAPALINLGAESEQSRLSTWRSQTDGLDRFRVTGQHRYIDPSNLRPSNLPSNVGPWVDYRQDWKYIKFAADIDTLC